MSDLLAAAAQVVGAPEELVQRSAEARAGADGVSVEEVLAAWAGGGPTPTSPPAVERPPPEPAATTPAAVTEPPAAPQPAVTPPAAPPPPLAPAVPPPPRPSRPVAVADGPPPVLKGRVDRPFRYFFGGAALLILCLVVTLVLPTLAGRGRGAIHSEIDFTAAARQGQDVYLSQGCQACHTQLVRPIVADAQLAASAGLGGITLSDTNQVVGRQRYGPDLANVGSRMSPEAIGEVLSGEGGHIPYRGGDLDALVAYLVESKVLVEASG